MIHGKMAETCLDISSYTKRTEALSGHQVQNEPRGHPINWADRQTCWINPQVPQMKKELKARAW